MRKIYCDVCGAECEQLESMSFSMEYSEGPEEWKKLTYDDLCWGCRTCIARIVMGLELVRKLTYEPTTHQELIAEATILTLSNELDGPCADCGRKTKCVYVEKLASEKYEKEGKVD